MYFIIIIAVIIILIINDKYQKLKIENDKLKQNQRINFTFCPHCGTNLSTYGLPDIIPIPANNKPINVQPSSQETIKTKKVKEQIANLSKEEQKNNIILITGAILIVLSALIFLGSTWALTGNVTKTIVIFLMLIIFYILSNISENHFHLHQTAQVFFYIALCYIPISLLSISLFGLFGHYLSIYGSGKFIYFSICSLVVSLFYYAEYKQKPTIFLKILLELFSYITIIFSCAIFNTNISLYYVIILVYIILREYISVKTKTKTEDKILFLILNIKNIIAFNVLSFALEFNETITIFTPVFGLLILLSLYILLIKIYNNRTFYNYIYPASIIYNAFIFSDIALFNFSDLICQIIVLLSYLPLIIYSINKYKEINKPTYFTIFLTSLFIYCLAPEMKGLTPSIILVILFGITLMNYILSSSKNIYSYFVTILTIFLSLSLKDELELSNSILLLITESILIIPLLIKNLEPNLKKSSYLIGTITITLELLYIVFKDITYTNAFLTLLSSIIFITYYLKNQKELNKFLSYASLTASISLFLELSAIEHSITLGISLSTIILTFLELLINRLKTEHSYIYLILSTILSSILLNQNLIIINFITLIVLDISLIYYIITNNINQNYYYIPAIFLIPFIFLSDLLLVQNLNGMIFLAIAIIFLTSYLSYLKHEINNFTFISFLYLICSIIFLDLGIYINMGILLFNSYLHYISNTQENKKDFFLFLITTSILVITRQLFIDIELDSITALSIGSILIYFITVSRTIVKKHIRDYKVLEYIVLSIINLIAIPVYTNEIDGILYVSLLIGLIIIGYSSKMGPIFLTSIIFVILNALILTREFWLSIPWWIYVLAIGIILVLFAMRNEARNNESKSKIDKIKKELDI